MGPKKTPEKLEKSLPPPPQGGPQIVDSLKWSPNHTIITVSCHWRDYGHLGWDSFENECGRLPGHGRSFITLYVIRSVVFKFSTLAVSINTESGDIIHIVHIVVQKMKEFIDFNNRYSVKSQCMGKYSIINMTNKKVLGHITTCLQSKVWGWALWWKQDVYIHISSYTKGF